jgi:hypothetical protein
MRLDGKCRHNFRAKRHDLCDELCPKLLNRLVQMTQFQFAKKPEELPAWQAFCKFMYNKDTSEVMGRTGMSWRK